MNLCLRLALTSYILIVFTFSGCKKGEDAPITDPDLLPHSGLYTLDNVKRSPDHFLLARERNYWPFFPSFEFMDAHYYMKNLVFEFPVGSRLDWTTGMKKTYKIVDTAIQPDEVRIREEYPDGFGMKTYYKSVNTNKTVVIEYTKNDNYYLKQSDVTRAC